MGLLNFDWTTGQNRPEGAAPLLSVENVSVRLGQRLVLDDVSLDLYEGEQVRVTGPNGAGKSTLLNTIMGLVPLATGRIRFKGEDMAELPTHERSLNGIRYMRQRDNVFPSVTVSDNLRLALGTGGYERFRESFPDWARDIQPTTQAGMLSGGQKQKLAWGMTVLGDGDILLMDEPEAGIAKKKTFLSIPNASTMLFVTHN